MRHAMWCAIHFSLSAEPISIFNQIIYSDTTNSLSIQACITQLAIVCLLFFLSAI